MNEIVVLLESTKGGVSGAVPEMEKAEMMTNRLIFKAVKFNVANYRKNNTPIVGKIFCQSSEKY